MPGKKRKADKKAGFGQGSGSTLVDASIAADPLRNLPQIVKIELRKMLGKKDGGLAEAIEKVKAKEMEKGGEATKAPTREEMNKLQEFFNDKTPPGVTLPMGREGIKKIMKQLRKIRGMEKGGEAVPAKFKGFSKLPEEVQKKMDPALAERFEDGGPVKMGAGGGVCKGMGIARAGGKFKVR